MVTFKQTIDDIKQKAIVLNEPKFCLKTSLSTLYYYNLSLISRIQKQYNCIYCSFLAYVEVSQVTTTFFP